MAFTLWNLFEASLLCLNAVCILHEERFLTKIGWSAKSPSVHGFGENPSAKAQILNLIHSIRTVARSRLMDILVTRPELVQDLCSELVLELINNLLQPKYKIFIHQIICLIVISPAALTLERNPLGTLCCIKGALSEHTVLQKFVRRSNWKCCECHHTNRCLIYKKFPKKSPLCPSCAAEMKEISNGRDMGNYIEGGLVDITMMSKSNINPITRSIRFRMEDSRIMEMELGNEYVLTGVYTSIGFDVWGCTPYEAVFRQAALSSRLELLRLKLQNDPWIFVHILSNLMGAKQILSDFLTPLRTGLLLSLASTKTPRPVHILAVCKDYDVGMNLMIATTNLAGKCIRCNYPLTKIGVTYDEVQKKYVGDALTLASGGVCYLGNWDPYINKRGFPVKEAVQYSRIPIAGADGEYVPLRCAVWTILEKPTTKKQYEKLKTLSQVFGIVWTTCLPSEAEEEAFVDLILNRCLFGDDQISDEELKKYINSTSDYKVDLTEEAVELVQKYFVSARRIRGENLPLTSLEPLTSLAEAHARLNRRTHALIEDVMVAIHLCELSLEPCMAFPPPPTDLRSFPDWLATNVMQSYISTDYF